MANLTARQLRDKLAAHRNWPGKVDFIDRFLLGNDKAAPEDLLKALEGWFGPAHEIVGKCRELMQGGGKPANDD